MSVEANESRASITPQTVGLIGSINRNHRERGNQELGTNFLFQLFSISNLIPLSSGPLWAQRYAFESMSLRSIQHLPMPLSPSYSNAA